MRKVNVLLGNKYCYAIYVAINIFITNIRYCSINNKAASIRISIQMRLVQSRCGLGYNMCDLNASNLVRPSALVIISA